MVGNVITLIYSNIIVLASNGVLLRVVVSCDMIAHASRLSIIFFNNWNFNVLLGTYSKYINVNNGNTYAIL